MQDSHKLVLCRVVIALFSMSANVNLVRGLVWIFRCPVESEKGFIEPTLFSDDLE